ncbi:secreted protein containing ATPase, AAA-type, core domain protein [Candidatus Magnetomorum sp. HK-1]|nr:secreted protein containing ATPase, AAA-type, core domain protein [Candidatus Magnetomorum sp. HK-1]
MLTIASQKNNIILLCLTVIFFYAQADGKNYPPIFPKGEDLNNINNVLKNMNSLGKVYSISFSPDGKTIASGDSDQIRLWNIASGIELQRFLGHKGSVNSLCFSSDGKFIVSGGSDQTVRLWDVMSGSELKQLKKHQKGIESVCFSPDDKIIASSSTDQTIRLWDRISGAEIKLFSKNKPVLSVCFSPDGKFIACGGVDLIFLLDISSGTEIKRFHGKNGWTLTLCFSPDGKNLASGSYDHILLWDISTGNVIKRFNGHKELIFSVCFSPDGKTIASGSLDQTVRLWDIESGTEIKRFEGHQSEVYAVSFSPQGKIVASSSMDRTIRLWDISTGTEIMQLGGRKIFQALCFSPDNTSIAFASDHTMRLWDVSSGVEKNYFKGYKGDITSISFSPDGNKIVSAGYDNSIRLWDISSQSEIMRFDGHTDNVTSIFFSPKDNMIVSGAEDKTVRLWDVSSGKEIKQFNKHKYGILSVCFSPNGKLVASGSYDQTIRLWDIESNLEIKKFEGHEAGVRSLCFSPDGNTIVSGSFDKSLRLWDIESGMEIKRFNGHEGIIFSICFTPDGKSIASGSDDQSLRLWDVASGDEIKRIDEKSEIRSLSFSPDGKTIAYGSDKLILRNNPLNNNNIQWFYGSYKKDRWISCNSSTQKCMRYDDGSIWNTVDKNNKVVPVLPPKPVNSGELEILSHPKILETFDGKLTSFRIILKNKGMGTLYGITFTQTASKKNSRLVFHPPDSIVILKPDEIIDKNCKISAKSNYSNPKEEDENLSLKISSAYTFLPVLSIPVRINTPQFEFVGAIKSQQDTPALMVTLKNTGSQALEARTEFMAKIENIPLDKIIRDKISANETINLSFALPESLELTKGSNLTIKVRKPTHPVHEWIFDEKQILLPGFSWGIIILNFFGILCILIMTYYLTRQTKGSTTDICLKFFTDIGYKKSASQSKDILIFINEKNRKKAIVFLYRENVSIPKISNQMTFLLKDIIGKIKIYLVYTTNRPETQMMQNLREISKCEVIPISESNLKKCIPQNKQEKERTLKEFEDPFITRTDPYMESTPINDPTWFYGRHKLIKTLPELLSQGQHVGLFGLRKVGKTSLVKQIQQRFVATPNVFIDCQKIPNQAAVFFEHILNELCSELSRLNIKDVPSFRTCDAADEFYKHFSKLFEQWKKAGNSLPFVVIIDEIDRLFQDREIKENELSLKEYVHLFKTLRGLAQSNNSIVTLVIAYRPDINRHNLLTSKVGENPMFRSFIEQYLGFLSSEESASMIREIGKWKDIIWTKDAASKVYYYCGGHPLVSRFFASMACNEGALKHVSAMRVQEAAKDIVKTFRKNDIGNYYEEGIWKLLFEEEKAVLSKICLNNDITEEQIPENIAKGLTNLENFGMVMNTKGRLSIHSDLFNQWLKRKLNT